MSKSLASPIGMWAQTARNGRRYHALRSYEAFEAETVCGLWVAETFGITSDEPEWDADVTSPPVPCPDCRRALR